MGAINEQSNCQQDIYSLSMPRLNRYVLLAGGRGTLIDMLAGDTDVSVEELPLVQASEGCNEAPSLAQRRTGSLSTPSLTNLNDTLAHPTNLWTSKAIPYHGDPEVHFHQLWPGDIHIDWNQVIGSNEEDH